MCVKCGRKSVAHRTNDATKMREGKRRGEKAEAQSTQSSQVHDVTCFSGLFGDSLEFVPHRPKGKELKVQNKRRRLSPFLFQDLCGGVLPLLLASVCFMFWYSLSSGMGNVFGVTTHFLVCSMMVAILPLQPPHPVPALVASPTASTVSAPAFTASTMAPRVTWKQLQMISSMSSDGAAGWEHLQEHDIFW